MPIASKVGAFTVESLGVEYPDYFQGYGLGPNSKYNFCAYGIGATEEEALADCLEQVAQQGFDLDDESEERIRAAFGDCDDSTTAAEELGLADDEVDEEWDASWHVGIKWNRREHQRFQRIRKIRNLQFLRYEDYRRGKDGGWGYATRAEGDVSYGDLKIADCPVCADNYFNGLSTDDCASGEVYFYVPHSIGSDYAGCTMTAANCKVFLETYGENDFVFLGRGDYSTYAAVVGLTGLLRCDEDTFSAICEAIEGLEDYPVLDDEALCEFEREKANEAWEVWCAREFREALEEKFDGRAEFNWPTDSDLRTFFERRAEEASVSWEAEESGPDVCIRIGKIVEGIDLDALDAWASRYRVSYVDVGAESEEFTIESAAIERVAQLCATGFAGAFYTAVTTDTK